MLFKNLFNQPPIKDIGTFTHLGQDYHCQRITYGSRRYVHVFRKGELHKHGLVFATQAEYNLWKQGLGKQLELFS
jgi:hypothetical protein